MIVLYKIGDKVWVPVSGSNDLRGKCCEILDVYRPGKDSPYGDGIWYKVDCIDHAISQTLINGPCDR